MPLELPRRALLAGGGAAALALAGCTGAEPEATERERDRRAETALRLRHNAARASGGLLARYDAALATHPALAPALAPLRAALAAQLAVLSEAGSSHKPEQRARQAEATASATAAVPEADPDPDRAVADLAAAERRVARERLAELAGAPPETARLLASLSAAGSVHVHLLNEARS